MARGGDTKPKTKPFRQLADKINADHARRARVDEHKRLMLAELRQSLDLTQTELAETLDVSQRGVSHIEHEANPRLGTLADYVDALGGRLELRAVFDDRTVELTPADLSTRKRSSTRAQGRPAARS
jgi:DNA-binding XRE family transcriptional regulator